MQNQQVQNPTETVLAKKLRYSKYDILELQILCPYIWECPIETVINWYQEHIHANHCDIGVGTGYFLEHCDLPQNSKLCLVDTNELCLNEASLRLQNHQLTKLHANILEGLKFEGELKKFDSIAINFLLHCIPGELQDKAVIFEKIKPLLNKGGTVFGATILGRGVKRNFIAKKLLRRFNKNQHFFNYFDCPNQLHKILGKHFNHYEIQIVGCVALFSAKLD